MKKDKSQNISKKLNKKKVNRKGVHSKKKNSKLKTSKNYKKAYRSQGR